MKLSTLARDRVKLPRLRLTQPVVIKGRNAMGHPVSLGLKPADNPGWYWQPAGQQKPIAINYELMDSKTWHLKLTQGDRVLRIYEHLGALRYTGLDGVIVENGSRHWWGSRFRGWTPFHGRTLEKWQAVAPYVEATDETIPFLNLSGSFRFESATDPSRYVSISPVTSETTVGLNCLVIIDYPNLGRREQRFQVPGADLEQVFQYHSQGWPFMGNWGYRISKYGGAVLRFGAFGWYHHDKAEWAHDHSTEETLRRWVLHRQLDLMGALSLLDHEKLPSASVFSHKGGHAMDVGLVHEIVRGNGIKS